ncbi:MAG: dipeptidyl aminopeptidase [Methylibium sp.]|nr:dipeptidyl aminopeptidase [Methylibium sp.]
MSIGPPQGLAGSGLPRRLAQAALHRLLLYGLRPARLSHTPGWTDTGRGNARVQVLRVPGRRGQNLAAWLALPAGASADQAAPLVACVHGWGANAATLWPVVEPLTAAGLAVLLFDAASHGDSTREDFSSLPRFAEDLADVLAALRAVVAIDSSRVALLGHSVGAGAVLLHAARQGGVQAVISLSAFAHPREVMQAWLRAHRLPARWPGELILAHVQAVIGERFDDIAPLHTLARVACPVLLVHGAQDHTVPLADARRLQAVLPAGELLVVAGDHDLRGALQPHVGTLVQFLGKHLHASAAPGAAWCADPSACQGLR